MKLTTIIFVALLLVGCESTPYPDPVHGRTVRIVRDEYGTPHIFAESIYGLYYGYGHSIAQDRLFQMEMAW